MILFGIVITFMIIYSTMGYEPPKEVRIKMFWVTITVLILLVIQFYAVPNFSMDLTLR